jgi:hypothetical protein
VTYTTPGSFWARYRQEQEARLAALAAEGRKAAPRCAVRGCTSLVRSNRDPARPGRKVIYCIRHADKWWKGRKAGASGPREDGCGWLGQERKDW